MKLPSPLLLSVVLLAMGASNAGAAVLSSWNFETNTPADLANSATGPSVVAEAGIFTTGFVAKGVHATANADWTTPTGNGSGNAYSVNEWTVGDYFEFATSTLGYQSVTIAFDQTGSNTGPKDFKLQYSIDGTAFTDVLGGAYSLINGGWSTGTPVTTTSYSFDLSVITALDDKSNIWLRMTDASTTAVNGTTVATGGTGRIDNISISATAVPETAVALLAGLGLLGLLRRRR